MINKEKILNFIPQYYLGGKIENVIWDISNKTVNIDFVDDSRTMVGKITVNDISMENGSYGIFNTSQLIKMLNTLDNDILLETVSFNGIKRKIKFSDQSIDVEFSLADESVIPKPPSIKLDEFDIICSIQKDMILKFIKSKESLPESSLLTVNTDIVVGVPVLTLTLGNSTNGANKIKITLEANVNKKIETPLPFNADNVKEILKANKDSDTSKIYINNLGLLKFHFEKNNITSIYYLSREN
jgi:hypothetical protein